MEAGLVGAGCGSGPRPRKGGYAARQDPRDLDKDIRLLQYIRKSEYTNTGSRNTMTNLSVSKLCKCLGDDLRLSLVCLMDVQREICVCDLVDALDAPQSTISRHLAQLRQCELVVARRQGTWMHYRLNPELPEWALTVIETLAEPARAQLDLRTPAPVCC